jgi:hypothetical protein
MQKKLAVEMGVGMGPSGRKQACRVVGLARSSAYYRREPSVVGLAKDGLVEEVSREWPGEEGDRPFEALAGRRPFVGGGRGQTF